MAEPDATALMRQLADLGRGFPNFAVVPTLLRLLADGDPVGRARIAAATGRDVDELFAGLPAAQWDQRGRLLGLGLSLVPTAHRFRIDGHRLYTWCATDALIFTVVLGRPATVDSTCPATGTAIHIELTPERLGAYTPVDTVVSSPPPDCRTADIRLELCAHGHFFGCAEAAEGWRAEHPTGTIRPLVAEFDLATRMVAALGWAGGGAA